MRGLTMEITSGVYIRCAVYVDEVGRVKRLPMRVQAETWFFKLRLNDWALEPMARFLPELCSPPSTTSTSIPLSPRPI